VHTVLTLRSVPARQTVTAAGHRVAAGCVLAAVAAPRAVVPVVLAVARQMTARTRPAETTHAATRHRVAPGAVRAVAHAAAVGAVTSFFAFCTRATNRTNYFDSGLRNVNMCTL